MKPLVITRTLFIILLTCVFFNITAQNKYLVKKVKGIYTTQPGLFDKVYKFELQKAGQGVYFDVKKADILKAGCDTSGLSAALPAKNGMYAGIMNGFGRFIVPPVYTVVQEISSFYYILGKKLQNGMWKIEYVCMGSEGANVYSRHYYEMCTDFRYIQWNRVIITNKDGKIGLFGAENLSYSANENVPAEYDEFQIIDSDLKVIDKSKLKYNSIETYYQTNINELHADKMPSGKFFELSKPGSKVLYHNKSQIFPDYEKVTKHIDGITDFYYVEFKNGKGAFAHDWNKDYFEKNYTRLSQKVSGNYVATAPDKKDMLKEVAGNYKDIVWRDFDGSTFKSRNKSGDWLVISIDSNNQIRIFLNFIGTEGWTAAHGMEYKLEAKGVEVSEGTIEPAGFDIGGKPFKAYIFSMGSYITEYKVGQIKSIKGWYNPATKELRLSGERHGMAGAVIITAKHE